MPTTTSAIVISTLSQPIKDIYLAGKDKFNTSLSKWANGRAVNALTKKVAAYEKIKTIWQRDKYVKLSSFYYPSKVTFHTEITKKVSSLKDIPQTGGLVIQGTVGQGKSIFLRYLCIQELQAHSSGRIPVFVELRKLDSKTTLKSIMYSTMENLGFEINDDLFDFYAETGKIVLLLDGFDELIDEQVGPVITQLETWAERYNNFQTIITSRPGGEIQKSSHFSVIRLAPLASDDHKHFLSKIGVKGKQLDNLLEAVANSPSEVKDFLNTPLLLTLLTVVYQTDGTIPSELPEFFQVLFTTVFSKHDGTKPGFKRPRRTDLNDRRIELLFESFCFSALRRNFGVALDDEQFAVSFEDALIFKNEKCDQSAFRHDLVKVACLLLEDGYKLTFAHKSLLEYFGASFIKHTTEKQAEVIYSGINTQQHWRPVLQYASHIDKYKYAKFFAIQNLIKTFKTFKIDISKITLSDAERVIDIMFENAHSTFHLDQNTQKHRQTGLSAFRIAETIYEEKLFMSTLQYSVMLIDGNFDEAELNQKLSKLSKPCKINTKGDFSVKWLDLIDSSRKSTLTNRIYDQLLTLAQQLESMSKYVKSEDEMANSLIFPVA